jgi:hypothetical protein
MGVQPPRGDVRMRWMMTRCGQHDIEPNSVWGSFEPLGCQRCAAVERQDPGEAVMPRSIWEVLSRSNERSQDLNARPIAEITP